MDCEAYRADLATRLSRNTVNNIWRVLRHILRYAQRHNAIPANPADAVDLGNRAPHDFATRRHALTASQVAAVATHLATVSPVYELLVLFMAYTGLRQAETQGLELRDVAITIGADGNAKGAIGVQRTKTRRHAEWHTGTPKSKASKRTVPLPPWLATRLADYLQNTHGDPATPSAPLWPRRLPGGARHKGVSAVVRWDWTQPCDLNALQSKVLRPAYEAVGLPTSRPAVDGMPATHGVRLHDWRHTFAALQLTNGTHFMQVSKWMGHASYVITMTVYADWIPDDGGVNDLPAPVAAPPSTNVVSLFG
jgi:integrase